MVSNPRIYRISQINAKLSDCLRQRIDFYSFQFYNHSMNITRCDLCPNMCGVDRTTNQGLCGVSATPRIARIGLHMYEEPIISGEKGSGTIFFSGCNMKCLFCQNYDVSARAKGIETTVDEIIQKIKTLEENGAHNINFVTPTHFVHIVKEILTKYKPQIPVVYNTSSYERPEILRELEGLVDIYLPDLKYYSSELSFTLSQKRNYFEIATRAIDEMFRQTGKFVIENGIMKKGIIIRHLVLPTKTDDSIEILKYIKNRYGDDVWLSLMSQYTPEGKAKTLPPYDRPLKKLEYTRVVQYAKRLGFENCFIQSHESVGEYFIPPFEGDTLY